MSQWTLDSDGSLIYAGRVFQTAALDTQNAGPPYMHSLTNGRTS